MKKVYLILGIVILSITGILLIYNKQNNYQSINYNGLKLAIVVNGKKTDALPTSGTYFLINYQCNNDSILSWIYDEDEEENRLVFDNHNTNDSCTLEFASSPKLYDLVNIGDYISYTGNSDNGCEANSCNGWNANQTDTDLYENYGGCSTGTQYRFTTYGWRVLYKEDNSVYIVSAGAPECATSTYYNNTQTIRDLSAASLKYCNELYQNNGECNYDTAHPFNDSDFYQFTSQYYGTANARHLSSTYGSNYCISKKCNKYCGYNNNIIDNGGYYWFDGKYSSTDNNYTLYWYPASRNITSTASSGTFGLRPVLKLDSSIQATGGAGTMTNPYTISERVTE